MTTTLPLSGLSGLRCDRPERLRSHMPEVPPGRQVSLPDGTETFVRIGGSPTGVPTLLLHGLGATSALNFAACFPALERLGPVIAPDHRGHGRDFRGAPADRLRFAALGAIAPAAHLVSPLQILPTPVLPGPLRRLSWAISELARHESPAIVAAARALGRYTSRDWIHDLTVPSAVIVHTDDDVVPTRRQRKLAAALPDARIVEVHGDHLAVANDPERYVPALMRAHRSVGRRIDDDVAA